ncbi:MAG TPA: hypothetical protein VFZ17_14520 [Acidimicrobiia bacterium]|nr:hypothetical protein [Acidimicrobiia bacterium]
MAFGQQSGPPASSSQLKQLLALLQDAGYTDFRDARGPMAFTQRQAGGKFTREEADALIEQLESAQETHERGEPAATPPRAAPVRRASQTDAALRRVPTERLAAELQRRGWIVVEP